MLPLIDYTNSAYTGIYFDASKTVLHLGIEHPTGLSRYIQQTPRLTSVDFRFNRTVFQSKKIAHTAIVTEVLEQTKLTRLCINASNQIIELPKSIRNHPLIRLEIRNAEKVTNLDLIHQLKDLKELVISGKNYTLGNHFPYLPELKWLEIRGEAINLLNLEKCTKLLDVVIADVTCSKIPEDSFKLPKLKSLRVSNFLNATKLPRLTTPNLEILRFQHFPSVHEISTDFNALPLLKSLNLQDIGSNTNTVNFPDSIVNCSALLELTLSTIPITTIPSTFYKLKNLKKLKLNNLPITSFPDYGQINEQLSHVNIVFCNTLNCVKNIEKLANLHSLEIRYNANLTTINPDFALLTKLVNITFDGLSKLATIDSSISKNTTLTTVELVDLPALKELPTFNKTQQQLFEITLSGLKKISSIPDKYTQLTNLNKLNISSDKIATLPNEIHQLKKLDKLRFHGSENSYLPPNTGLLNLNKLDFNYHNKTVSPINSQNLNRLLNSITNTAHKKAIMYWAGNAYKHLPITIELKTNTLEALEHPLKEFGLFILEKIAFFNTGNEKFSAINPTCKAWVNGALTGKTILKNKLKSLGFTVVNKYSTDVKLVVIGLKPGIPDGLFTNNVFFTNQLEINEIATQEKPKLLEHAEASEEMITNVQQLLWSGDSQNEAIALELVKSHGLPEYIEEDFLYAAKTCSDKNVRNRIRTFLKSQINAQKQKALSIGGSYFQIEKLRYVLNSTSITRMYYSQFKRDGTCAEFFLREDDGTHPNRNKVFKAIYPTLISNTKYLGSSIKLTETEWNMVLKDEVFLGNLHRVRINLTLCKQIPKALEKHINTLKTLEINISDGFNIASIYPFFKLNTLYIDGNNAKTKLIVPEGIGALNRLRRFRINSRFKIDLPTDYKALVHLK